MTLTTAQLEDLKTTPWDFGNQVLYNLCFDYPYHTDSNVVIAKVWLIGRAYAAAIERRKKKGSFESNDSFYENKVGPSLRDSKIDSHFEELRNIKLLDVNAITKALSLHKYLQSTFKQITEHENRSLASKYLHFHFPRLFYIYDTRAVSALGKFKVTLPKQYDFGDGDRDYATFFIKANTLATELGQKHGMTITPRHLDNLFMAIDRHSLPNP